MSTPRTSVILPQTTLTIPPSPKFTTTSSEPSSRPTNLKIRITPHLLVSCPPFAQGASGRKVEECVDVVVDIGGKVDLGLEVEEEGLGWATDGVWAAEEEVGRKVKRLFEANVSNIGLLSTSPPPFEPLPSTRPESTSTSSSSRPALRPALLRLTPLLSNPSHSHVLKTLCTTGRPQAVLTRVDIKLQWVPSGRKGKRRSGLNEDEDDDDDTQDRGAFDGEGGGEYDEDEFVDSEDVTLLAEAKEDSEGVEGKEGRAKLPKWVEQQLTNGLQKMIRTHMIRRFPLIFDAGLIQHTAALTLHRSLTSSLTHFLHLSSSHSTSLLRPALGLLRSIAQEEEIYLTLNVDPASSIKGTPIPKIPGTRRRKKRKTDQADEVEAEEQGMENTAKGRASAYLDQVHARIVAEDKGPRADERRVGRLVGEAMGRVGRAKWEMGRKGVGRMAAFRVPLKDIQPETIGGNDEFDSDDPATQPDPRMVIQQRSSRPSRDFDESQQSDFVPLDILMGDGDDDNPSESQVYPNQTDFIDDWADELQDANQDSDPWTSQEAANLYDSLSSTQQDSQMLDDSLEPNEFREAGDLGDELEAHLESHVEGDEEELIRYDAVSGGGQTTYNVHEAGAGEQQDVLDEELEMRGEEDFNEDLDMGPDQLDSLISD